jgi:prepilin-type N-terminal cleavage/methylation domain-containing protein
MKTPAIQIQRRRHRAGFTLLEMSTSMGIMLVLAVALVVMLQQHTQFMAMFRKQAFLTSEAPQIGNLLGRILNEADHYFVYATKDEALAGGLPVLTGGHALRLFFKTPTQEVEERLIVVEATATGNALKFYGWQSDGTPTSWTISDQIADAEFLSDQGILNMTLEGPNGEEVTYGGGAK